MDGRRRSFRVPTSERFWLAAAALVLLIFAAFRLLRVDPWSRPAWDVWAYWLTRGGADYALARQGDTGAFLYSPAFAQAIAPLVALPWPWFAALWTVLAAIPLLWLAGRWTLAAVLLLPVAMSVALGQLEPAFAAVALLGLRWPAVWALPLLTKVTPGVGLVWFAARREWRSLAIAFGATGLIAVVSAVLDPGAWAGWLGMLARVDFPELDDRLLFLPVPMWIRLPAAAALVAWGARTDRRWVLPLGMLLALPTVWLQAPTILVALLPLSRLGADTPAGRWLRAAVPAGATRPAEGSPERGATGERRRGPQPWRPAWRRERRPLGVGAAWSRAWPRSDARGRRSERQTQGS